MTSTIRLKTAYLLGVALLFAAADAEAFRCGRKLVLENMHEAAVRNICGEPSSERHIGFTVHGTFYPLQNAGRREIGLRERHLYGQSVEEVAVTELIYNFGPRRLMQRLVFEGGILKKIESIGYGFREK